MLPSQVMQWSKRSQMRESSHQYLISRSVWFLIISRRSHRFRRTKSDLEKCNHKINSSSLINQSDSNIEENRPNFMLPYLVIYPRIHLYNCGSTYVWAVTTTEGFSPNTHLPERLIYPHLSWGSKLRWWIAHTLSEIVTKDWVRKHMKKWTKLGHP